MVPSIRHKWIMQDTCSRSALSPYVSIKPNIYVHETTQREIDKEIKVTKESYYAHVRVCGRTESLPRKRKKPGYDETLG